MNLRTRKLLKPSNQTVWTCELEGEEAEVVTAYDVVILLDGQPLDMAGSFSYAIDNEGYAAGTFKYFVRGQERPQVGDSYDTLVLALVETEGWRPFVEFKNIVLHAEIGEVSIESGLYEVECRWHTDGN